MIYSYFLVCMLSIILSVSSYAGYNWFSYSIPFNNQDSATLNQLCKSTAADLEYRYIEASGRKKAIAECEGFTIKENGEKKFVMYSLKLSDGPNIVEIWSTYLGYASSLFTNAIPGGAFGVFDSLEECLSNIPLQNQLMKMETEKASFFTSCLPAVSANSLVLRKFVLKFHLTEVPAKILYVADLGAYAENHVSEFTSMLTSLLTELKASVAYINKEEPRVWYYSSYSHSIVLNVVALHRGENALQICKDQLIELSPKMKTIGNGHYRLYCGEKSYGDNKSVHLFAMTDRFTYYNKTQSNESPKDGYVNLESCQKDQERVLKKIRTFKKAYAAICSEKLIGYDNSYLYEMTILTDKS